MPRGYAPKVEDRSQIIRYLQTDGEMGELPGWYRTIKAAQMLNVPPWELATKPLIWQEWAISAVMAESFVQKEQQDRAAKKAGARGKRGKR